MKNKLILLVFGILVLTTFSFAKADLNVPIILSFNQTTMRIQMDNLDFSKDLSSIYNISQNNLSNYTNYSSTQILIGKLTGENALNTDELLRNLTSWCANSLQYVNQYIECNLTVSQLTEAQNDLNFCNNNLSNVNYQIGLWTDAGKKYNMFNAGDISRKITDTRNGMIVYIVLALLVGAGGTWIYLKKKGTVSNREDKNLEY